MQSKAKAKFIRTSPRKLRLVADLVRGKDIEDAIVSLQFVKKAAALPLIKLLKSSLSNAEENLQLKKDNLFIKTINVDGGPTLKRWQPRAFGRATPLRKRSSHVEVVLEEKVPTEPKKKTKELQQDKKDDIVKIDDFDELKKGDISSEEKKEEIKKDTSKKTNKNFVGKFFNRSKSGDK